jgi:2-phosphosulfolactate phosphatase
MKEIIIDSTPDRGRYWSSRGFNVVAVDVLRATSTIVVALSRGAESIYPCAEIEESQEYSGRTNFLLVGERKGQIIEGFDHTNSPYDMSQLDLTGKSIVLTTSDGTRLIKNSAEAPVQLIGSTLNYEQIAKSILAIGGNWALIGAGSSGDFRPEDRVGCALIGKSLIDSGSYCADNIVVGFIKTYTDDWKDHILNSLSTLKLTNIGRRIDVDFVIDETNKYLIIPKVINIQGVLTIESV